MAGAVATVERLDGAHLANALRAGIYRLFSRAEHLNKINVFPVPDGDTGTNLTMTLQAVLAAVEREPSLHAGPLLTRAADAAIDGARGNSGSILAQFLLGVGDHAGALETLTTTDFAGAVRAGAAYARDALTEPREGTLITVLSDYANELTRLSSTRAAEDFTSLFVQSTEKLHASLAATRGQLPEMREANVVDAGAQGFVDLIDGMRGYFETGEVGEAVRPHDDPHEDMAIGGANSTDRFCTECLVSGPTVDPRKLREQMSALGSSLVVAGTNRKARIHIHTNDPEQVFRLAAEHGAVSAQKADDMILQTAAAHHARGRRVAIVTDSAADIPDDELARLQIHMVPLRVHFGSRSYLDKVSLSQEEFYRELAHNPDHPKTSQPPPGDFRRLYEFLISHFDSVVSISVTAKVSGTYNATRAAAQRIPDGRVTVIDSGNASLGQGLIAMYAAEYAEAGHSGLEVAAAAQAAVTKTKTYGLLGRLDFAVRGGRVPRIVGKLATLLHFAPILATNRDGRIASGGMLFGTRNLRPRFAAFIRRRIDPNQRYRISVGHANAESEGHQLLTEITAGLTNVESSYLTPLGTALGVHGGPGMLVVALQQYDHPARAPKSAPLTPDSPSDDRGLARANIKCATPTPRCTTSYPPSRSQTGQTATPAHSRRTPPAAPHTQT
jgi:DegV family protein with EDD domain